MFKNIRSWPAIAALLVLLLCGFYACVRFIAPMGPREFAAVVKKSADPEELRRWAFSLSPNLESIQFSNSTAPKAVLAAGKRGYGFGPQTERTAAPDGRGYYVRLWWGYSFGNGYAIIIGPTNLTIPPHREVVPWVPGIYFTDPWLAIDPVWDSSAARAF